MYTLYAVYCCLLYIVFIPKNWLRRLFKSRGSTRHNECRRWWICHRREWLSCASTALEEERHLEVLAWMPPRCEMQVYNSRVCTVRWYLMTLLVIRWWRIWLVDFLMIWQVHLSFSVIFNFIVAAMELVKCVDEKRSIMPERYIWTDRCLKMPNIRLTLYEIRNTALFHSYQWYTAAATLVNCTQSVSI